MLSAIGTTAPLTGHRRAVTSLALHPDGRYAITGNADNMVRIWDLARGTCNHILSGHRRPVTGAALHPDGSRALTAAEDGTVRIWDVATGRSLGVLAWHHGTVSSVRFLPGGNEIVTVGEDKTIRIGRLGSERAERVITNTTPLLDLELFPGGQRAITLGGNGLKIWDLRGTDRPLHTYREAWARVSRVLLLADGRTLVTPTRHDLHVWDLQERGDPVLVASAGRWDGPTVARIPSSDRLLIVGTTDAFRVLEVDLLRRAVTERASIPITSPVTACAGTRDGHVAFGTYEGQVHSFRWTPDARP